MERPSRWKGSKTWRSPSSPQIHQKYLHLEQLLQNTDWMLAEDLRLPKRQETPHVPGYGKRKREKTDKRIGKGPALLGESCEGGKVSTHWKPLRGRWLREAEGGSFGATEESAATGVQRAKRRDSRTEDRCQPALTSPRGLSAHPPGQVGAGSWGSGFGGQIPGRGWGLAAWTQPEGGYCTTASWEGVQEKVWSCLRGKRPLFQGTRGEGIQSTA